MITVSGGFAALSAVKPPEFVIMNQHGSARLLQRATPSGDHDVERFDQRW
jgi:hypothetical protein